MESCPDLTSLIRPTRPQSASGTPHRAEGSSGYHRNCGSEPHRWSPYARNRKPLTVKSLSLESVSSLKEAEWSLQFLNDFHDTTIIPKDTLIGRTECQHGFESDTTAWYVYARFLRTAWRSTRASVIEQGHRAERSELQAKYNLSQVSAMKSQLHADISKMREHVKQIDTTNATLDKLEDEKTALQTENDSLRIKLGNANADENQLKSTLSNKEDEFKLLHAQKESLLNQISISKDELTALKIEKSSLDQLIQDHIAAIENGQEMLKTGRKNLHNLELEINDILKAIQSCCDSIKSNAESLASANEEATAIRSQIDAATEGTNILQAQLSQLRCQIIERDATMAEISGRVKLTAAEIADLKSRSETRPKFDLWRRLKLFNSESGSLISLQI